MLPPATTGSRLSPNNSSADSPTPTPPFLLYDDTTIVGIAAYDGETAELAVTPSARRHGGATLLIDLMGHKPLWAHGNLQPAQHFARHLGYTPSRELLVMAIDGDPLTAATAYQFPDGVELLDLPTAYDRYGSETVDQLWLEANNQAFSWHPEQGGWDLDRLNQARDTDWYRPDDVLTLWENSKLLGFHWVKRHGDLRAGAKGKYMWWVWVMPAGAEDWAALW